MPPDDLVERPLPDPASATARKAETTRLVTDALGEAQQEKPEGDLIFAWAPFAVEFGQSWWFDAAPEPGPFEPEPELAFTWAPFPVEFGASWWLDPERATTPGEPQPPLREQTRPFALLGSLAIHLLPLLVLLDWAREPTGSAGAIPVQLVLEQPRTAIEKAPSVDRPATEDIGETIPRAKEAPARQPRDSQPPPAQTAAAVPPPPKPIPPPAPRPPAEPTPPSPQPSSKPQAQAAARPAATTAAVAAAQSQRAVSPGPDTAQGDYFSYLVTLTRRHSDMLSLSFLAGRRGETILSVVVLNDGTIAHIAVKHSSGYPDIDARIEEMVAAVGRFPPPPQRYQGSNLDMDFKLAFPNAVEGQ